MYIIFKFKLIIYKKIFKIFNLLMDRQGVKSNRFLHYNEPVGGQKVAGRKPSRFKCDNRPGESAPGCYV